MPGSFVAAGNVTPSRFVKGGTAVGTAVLAGASDVTIGVAQESTRNTPYSTLDDGYAAISGENLRVYQDQEECYLESGAAFSVFAFLKPSTNGVAITASADHEFYGAQALQAATAAGQLIRCRVVRGYISA